MTVIEEHLTGGDTISTVPSVFSFRLNAEFVAGYKDRVVPWGYKDAAGNSVGEITFIRTYSRLKADGTKERWWEVCKRVIEGMFTIQKDYCIAQRLPWNQRKAQRAAQDAFDRMYTFKWLPPGRGLWMMGTPLVMEQRNSAALQNCAFVSTADMTRENPAEPFAFLMEASMLGVGVGFDTRGVERDFAILEPKEPAYTYQVPDTREGWVELMSRTLEAFLKPGSALPIPDVSLVRPSGTPIKTFGGTAAGPEPLLKLYHGLVSLFQDRAGTRLGSADIADIGNLIGVCVVSGNVRRSAELLQGRIDDEKFLNLKNYGHLESNGLDEGWYVNGYNKGTEYVPTDEELAAGAYLETGQKWVDGPAAYRSEWGWMSNNSVAVEVGEDLDPIIEGIARNGEPGVIWLDVSRQYGRLVDPPNNKDWRIAGYNPCAEQSLESFEMCTLVETFPNRHETLEDFQRTCKVAYLYAKTVTLLPTHWERTNAIMQRNRRIGTSMSGIANFADNQGMAKLRTWMDSGYQTIGHYDRVYSEWLCIRESIKTTTVKPSGTVSILAGDSPGAHWAPGGEYFNRGIVFNKDDPTVLLLANAGYPVERSAYTPDTSVFVQFPVHSTAKRSEKDVTLFEKANLAVMAQRYWSDNSVSVTLSFDVETEAHQVGQVLHMYEGQLKTVSYLPMDTHGYDQAPYQEITAEQYDAVQDYLMPLDLEPIYQGLGWDAVGEAYCTTSACEIREFTSAARAAA